MSEKSINDLEHYQAQMYKLNERKNQLINELNNINNLISQTTGIISYVEKKKKEETMADQPEDS